MMFVLFGGEAPWLIFDDMSTYDERAAVLALCDLTPAVFASLFFAPLLSPVLILELLLWYRIPKAALLAQQPDCARIYRRARRQYARTLCAGPAYAAMVVCLFCASRLWAVAVPVLLVYRQWWILPTALLCAVFRNVYKLGFIWLVPSWAYGFFWPSSALTACAFVLYALEGWLLYISLFH